MPFFNSYVKLPEGKPSLKPIVAGYITTFLFLFFVIVLCHLVRTWVIVSSFQGARARAGVRSWAKKQERREEARRNNKRRAYWRGSLHWCGNGGNGEKMSRDGFGAWEMCPQFVKMDENGENEVSHLTLGVMSLFSNKAGCWCALQTHAKGQCSMKAIQTLAQIRVWQLMILW